MELHFVERRYLDYVTILGGLMLSAEIVYIRCVETLGGSDV
jgi:hypothetical protein